MKKLLTTLGLLISLLSAAQEDTMKYIKYPTSQVQYGGIWAKTYLRIPDTSRVNALPGAVGKNAAGTSLFLWNGTTWTAISGGTGNFVDLTTNQTIGGVKTFGDFPKILSNGFTQTIRASSVLTNNVNFDLPKIDGTAVISVNGNTPNSNGNVDIDTLVYSTRRWRQKGIDSVVSLIPSTSSFLRIQDSTIYSTKANATKQRDSVVGLLSSVSATRLTTAVYNNSGSTITKGSVVYINGAHSSNLPTVALAKANNETTSAYTYGLVESDILNNSQGTVIQSGVITNLNLPTSTYTDGQTLYLSPTVAGGYTLTKPLAPNHYVAIGTITRAHPTFGTIQIAIRNGFQLDEISDVSIALVPIDSTILQFSRVDSLWHDVDPTTAMGNRFVKRTDTSSMLSPYIRSAGYGLTKSSQSLLADSLLLSTRAWRQKGLDSLARLELSISDTATMLSPYLRKADTTTLSNRINLKQNTVSLTTTGSSGAATFSSSTLNVPNYTLAGLGGEPAITAGTTSQYWRGDKTWQTLTTTQSGTYADMIAVSSPTAGQQFFVTDYIPGLYVYSSFTSDWQYQSNIQNVYVNQNFTTQTSASVFQHFRATLVTSTMGAAVTGDANAKFGSALVCSSATTTSGTILLQGNSTGFGVHSGSKKHGWIVRLSEADVPTASEDFSVLIGTTNNANSVPFIGFSAHRSYSNNWTAISSTSFNASAAYDVGASTTYTNTGVAINSGYNELTVLVDEAAPSVKFYINGTLVATHTTNIPASGAAGLLSGAIFKKLAGSTNRSVRFDYLTAYVYKK